jgi:hypothetical protein
MRWYHVHYFIHILTDEERIADPDGGEFPDLEAARAEACQTARELLANELIAGRTMPLGWRAQIVDREENVVSTLPFAELVPRHDVQPRSSQRRSYMEAVDRANAIMARANKCKSEIRGGFEQVWAQLRILGRINSELGGASVKLKGRG